MKKITEIIAKSFKQCLYYVCPCVCEYCLLLWGKGHALKIENTDKIAQDTYQLLIFNDGLFSIKEHNATELLSQSIFVFFH